MSTFTSISFPIFSLYIDIDECALGTHNCAHSCSNSLGSYTCSCRDGFELGQDGRTCKGTILNLVKLEVIPETLNTSYT